MFEWYWKTIVPEFRCNGVFAIVAIAMDKKASSGPEACFDATFLARLSTSPSADEVRDFDRLSAVLTEVVGISFHDIYRNSYSLARPEATTAQKAYFRPQPKEVIHEMEGLSSEERDDRIAGYRNEILKLARRGEHTRLKDLPTKNKFCLRFRLSLLLLFRTKKTFSSGLSCFSRPVVHCMPSEILHTSKV